MKKLTLLIPLIYSMSLVASPANRTYSLSEQDTEQSGFVIIKKITTTTIETTSVHQHLVNTLVTSYQPCPAYAQPIPMRPTRQYTRDRRPAADLSDLEEASWELVLAEGLNQSLVDLQRRANESRQDWQARSGQSAERFNPVGPTNLIQPHTTEETHTDRTTETKTEHYPLAPNQALSFGLMHSCWPIAQRALQKGAILEDHTKLESLLGIAAQHRSLDFVFQKLDGTSLQQVLVHGANQHNWSIAQRALQRGAVVEANTLRPLLNLAVQQGWNNSALDTVYQNLNAHLIQQALEHGTNQHNWPIAEGALQRGAVVEINTLRPLLNLAAQQGWDNLALDTVYQNLNSSLLQQAFKHGISQGSQSITQRAIQKGARAETADLQRMVSNGMQNHALDIALDRRKWSIVKSAIEHNAHLYPSQYEILFECTNASDVLDLALSRRNIDLTQQAITAHHAPVKSQHLCTVLGDIHTELNRYDNSETPALCSIGAGVATSLFVAAASQEVFQGDNSTLTALTAVACGASTAAVTWLCVKKLRDRLATVDPTRLTTLLQGSCSDQYGTALTTINGIIDEHQDKPRVLETLNPLRNQIASIASTRAMNIQP